jgi:hypothetical protein
MELHMTQTDWEGPHVRPQAFLDSEATSRSTILVC